MGDGRAPGQERADGRAATGQRDTAGHALLRARLRLGLTQQQLAEAIVRSAAHEGIDLTLTASAVSRWEAGKFRPAPRYRPHLSRVLAPEPADDRAAAR